MSDPQSQPSWIDMLRQDIAQFRLETNQRLDRLVSTDAFNAEQRRVDDLIARLGQDLVEERAARTAADKDLEGDIKSAAAKADAAQEATESRRVSFRQAMQVALVTTLVGGLVSVVVLIIQNAAHLG